MLGFFQLTVWISAIMADLVVCKWNGDLLNGVNGEWLFTGRRGQGITFITRHLCFNQIAYLAPGGQVGYV